MFRTPRLARQPLQPRGTKNRMTSKRETVIPGLEFAGTPARQAVLCLHLLRRLAHLSLELGRESPGLDFGTEQEIRLVKYLLPAAILFLTAGIGVGIYFLPSRQPAGQVNGSANAPPSTPADSPGTSAEDELTEDLVSEGWDREAAEAVARLTAPWFTTLAREKPLQRQKQLKLLQGLGQSPQVMPLLARRPESAGLLAASARPERLARILDEAGHGDYPLVAS